MRLRLIAAVSHAHEVIPGSRLSGLELMAVLQNGHGLAWCLGGIRERSGSAVPDCHGVRECCLDAEWGIRGAEDADPVRVRLVPEDERLEILVVLAQHILRRRAARQGEAVRLD